ncbi:hypothetical protein ACRASH_02075, partial [Staphylococcus aureus]
MNHLKTYQSEDYYIHDKQFVIEGPLTYEGLKCCVAFTSFGCEAGIWLQLRHSILVVFAFIVKRFHVF